jgi:hypothetical protein
LDRGVVDIEKQIEKHPTKPELHFKKAKILWCQATSKTDSKHELLVTEVQKGLLQHPYTTRPCKVFQEVQSYFCRLVARPRRKTKTNI